MGSTPPPVLRLGHSLLLSGPALIDTYALVSMALRVTRERDAIEPPRRYLELRRLLGDTVEYLRVDAQQMSASDIADVRGASTEQSGSREVSAVDAAERLGLSTRQVTRIARSLGGRQPAGPRTTWVFDEAAVAAYAETNAHRDQETA